MGNSLLHHYIDNCFKKGYFLWGQKHCDWGGANVRNGGTFAPPVPMLKKALMSIIIVITFALLFHVLGAN